MNRREKRFRLRKNNGKLEIEFDSPVDSSAPPGSRNNVTEHELPLNTTEEICLDSVQPSQHDKDRLSAAALIDEEDQARSGTYAILSALLGGIPNQDLIDYLRHIEDPADTEAPGDMGEAWLALREAATAIETSALDDEYHALFIGLGRGEVVPFGSWHLTGFLMEKPLSDLRDDLRELGFETDGDYREPEDHIAAICETISLLIGSPDVESYRQRVFYMKHLHPWGEKFFRELQSAKSARFYRAVGLLGERFMQLENLYLNVQQH